jgi:hypothetical protein
MESQSLLVQLMGGTDVGGDESAESPDLSDAETPADGGVDVEGV